MTALPLFWDEADMGGALRGEEVRAPIIQELAKSYTVEPIDLVTPVVLRRLDILMLAQPRALSASELVLLDDWVLGGGQILVFADPLLLWPSVFPHGDPRRAPEVTLLDPLFTHWGLTMSTSRATEDLDVAVSMMGKPTTLMAHGLWASNTANCKLADSSIRAICRIGDGTAQLVADADMLNLDGEGGGLETNLAATQAILDSFRQSDSKQIRNKERTNGRFDPKRSSIDP
jgi:ABC-type uncharacterized transport system